MRIGILALQGAFAEHEHTLSRLGTASFEIRQRKDLIGSLDGIIIPGGESTVQGKLLHELDLLEPIREMIGQGLPVFGTCAGLILLAEETENDNRKYLATMGITAVRNAYGRQLGSFHTEDSFNGKAIPMTFIRAPYISRIGADVEILASVGDRIVAARQDRQLVTAFHPELDDDVTVHEYFLSIVRSADR